jgi:DNA-binding response OmpR family regulator
LELGADDYIVKPPSMRELIARIRAVHRRTSPAELPEGDAAPRSAFASGTPNTVFGGVSIDLKQRVASAADGEQIPLTGTEFDVLAILVEQAGNVVSRDFLSKAVLRRDYSPSDRSLDQLVHRIRAKLAAEDPSYQIIQSVRGVGYRLVAPKTT